MSKTVVVTLADGFEEIEAITVIDVLRRGGLKVIAAGLGKETITAAHDITVRTDTTVEAIAETPDAVVLPGGMPGSAHLGESEAVKRLVLKVKDAGGIYAAICAAPAKAFARFGVLESKQATCYPGCESDFPPSATFREDRVVVDGNLVTSRAPGTAMYFALTLVELLTDKTNAEETGRRMLVAR